jgi:polysaccharide biosynthesis protein PslH
MSRPRLLFLAHRIPYPPDKGEKIRAFHELEALASIFDVEVICFIETDLDAQNLLEFSQLKLPGHPSIQLCSGGVKGIKRHGMSSKVRALLNMRPGASLSVLCFNHPQMHKAVAEALLKKPDMIFLYSGAMMQYVKPKSDERPFVVLDLVDADSEKWRNYAETSGSLGKAFWTCEANALLEFEKKAVLKSDVSFVVSKEEAECLMSRATALEDKVAWVPNGVDPNRFNPSREYLNPFSSGTQNIVFTGTMNYRPNVEAVERFAKKIMPRIQCIYPQAQFHIVGASPSKKVMTLRALHGIHVTGTVPDTRPYIAHSDVCVAPLGIARGVQNKILEAMSMGKPVVATSKAVDGISGVIRGKDLLVSDDDESIAQDVCAVLSGQYPKMGDMARHRILESSWTWAQKKLLDLLLPLYQRHINNLRASSLGEKEAGIPSNIDGWAYMKKDNA